jgi:hypothetical protein
LQKIIEIPQKVIEILQKVIEIPQKVIEILQKVIEFLQKVSFRLSFSPPKGGVGGGPEGGWLLGFERHPPQACISRQLSLPLQCNFSRDSSVTRYAESVARKIRQ